MIGRAVICVVASQRPVLKETTIPALPKLRLFWNFEPFEWLMITQLAPSDFLSIHSITDLEENSPGQTRGEDYFSLHQSVNVSQCVESISRIDLCLPFSTSFDALMTCG